MNRWWLPKNLPKPPTQKPPLTEKGNVKSLAGTLGFDDFAATQTGGADANALALAVNFGMYRAQIDVPTPLGHVVSVADAVSRLRLLAADFTLLCH